MDLEYMRYSLLTVFLLCLLFVVSCSDDDASQQPPVSNDVHLHEHATFPIGVAVPIAAFENGNLRTDVQSNELVLRHFNSLTAENVMKFGLVHPEKKQYYWDDADWLITFAEQNNMQVHGHTLVWHNQTAPWVMTFSGNWDSLLINHITMVVERYRGKVKSWDVVNEAFNDDGTLRETIWSSNISDYQAKSFVAARSADPDAALFYNDYNLIGIPDKLNAVLEMVDDFKRRDVPIDGIGFQAHILDSWPSQSAMEQAFKKVVDKGLMVHISELDVSVNFLGVHASFTESLAEKQRKQYEGIVRAYRTVVPDSLQAGITVWGVTDRFSWIRSQRMDWPLLFDENYDKKLAFDGFYDGLQ